MSPGSWPWEAKAGDAKGSPGTSQRPGREGRDRVQGAVVRVPQDEVVGLGLENRVGPWCWAQPPSPLASGEEEGPGGLCYSELRATLFPTSQCRDLEALWCGGRC